MFPLAERDFWEDSHYSLHLWTLAEILAHEVLYSWKIPENEPLTAQHSSQTWESALSSWIYSIPT